MVKKLNGYVVKVYPFELKGLSVDRSFISYPEALHYARKFYRGIDKWEVYHPNGKLMVYDEFNEKGEIELMSNFADLATKQGAPFASKELLATLGIRLTVTKVAGPFTSTFPETKTKMRTVESWHLTVGMSQEDVERGATDKNGLPNLATEMRVSFEKGYEGRDALIEALKQDVDSDGTVYNVVVFKSGNFYSLTSIND